MLLLKKFTLSIFALFTFASANVNNDVPYVELQLTKQVVRQTDTSLPSGVLMYTEKSIGPLVFFGQLYYDTEFSQGIVGVSKLFGDLQLSFGVGNSRLDRAGYLTASPWLYYGNKESNIQALAYAEYYRTPNGADRMKPWYKGRFEKGYGPLWLGAYGQSGFGVGPFVGFKLNEHFKLWTTPSVAFEPKNDPGSKTKSIITGINIEF